MMKISILGAGRVGSTLGYLLANNKDVDELVFVDEIKTLLEGTVLDISDAFPESSLKITSGDLSAANNSDIIVVAASGSTDPKVKIRMELLGANKPVIEKIFSSLTLKKSTIVIVVTNPVEPLCAVVSSVSKINPQNIIGFGSSLDTARLKTILSKKTKTSADKIDTFVIGEHGENMIPLFNSTKINGKPIELFHIDLDKINNQLLDEGRKIRQFTGGVRFGPARHLFDLILSIAKDKNRIIPVGLHIDKSIYYGLEDVFVSLPAKISSRGISEIVEIPLSKDEKEKLITLSEHLKGIQKNL